MRLFLAEFTRGLILFLRYPGEAIGGIISITMIFFGLFLGAQYIAGPGVGFGDRLDAIVVGYVLWTVVLFAMSNISWNLQTEAQTGTLEQVFLTPHGVSKVVIVRALADLSLNLMLNVAILLIIMALTGSRLHFPAELIFPLATVLLGSYGLALVLGSLALLLKRVQQVLNLVQFVLLFLIMTPVETWTGPLGTLGTLLPLAPAAGMLRDLMARGLAFDPAQFAAALANGAVYFAAGFLIFSYAVRTAKGRGLVGGY